MFRSKLEFKCKFRIKIYISHFKKLFNFDLT